MKRSIRADKRGYIDNLARQAKETAAQGNMKGLYDITRKLLEDTNRQTSQSRTS